MPTLDALPFWVQSLGLLSGALVGGYLLRTLIQGLLRWRASREQIPLLRAVNERAAGPLGWVLSIALLQLVLPLAVAEGWLPRSQQAAWVLQVILLAWLITRLLRVGEDMIVSPPSEWPVKA